MGSTAEEYIYQTIKVPLISINAILQTSTPHKMTEITGKQIKIKNFIAYQILITNSLGVAGEDD